MIEIFQILNQHIFYIIYIFSIFVTLPSSLTHRLAKRNSMVARNRQENLTRS